MAWANDGVYVLGSAVVVVAFLVLIIWHITKQQLVRNMSAEDASIQVPRVFHYLFGKSDIISSYDDEEVKESLRWRYAVSTVLIAVLALGEAWFLDRVTDKLVSNHRFDEDRWVLGVNLKPDTIRFLAFALALIQLFHWHTFHNTMFGYSSKMVTTINQYILHQL